MTSKRQDGQHSLPDEGSKEQNESSTGRRKFLQRSGILMAAFSAYGLKSSEAAGASTAANHINIQHSVANTNTTAPYRIDLDVVDHVDGYMVIRPKFQANLNGSLKTVSDIGFKDGLSIEVTQGEAKIVEDLYTGNILIAPIGSTPVKVRGVLRPLTEHADGPGRNGASTILGNPMLVGAETHIGFASSNVAYNQLALAMAGGGACAASTSLSTSTQVPQQLINRLHGMGLSSEAIVEMARGYNFKLRVRASIAANVIPVSETQREILWKHGLYYALDPVLGRMRLQYNSDPAYQSKTIMQSNAVLPDGHNFFPASGVNQLYFVLDFLDLGYHVFNKEPMNLFFKNTQWPPYATPLDIERPVHFYNVDNHNEVILTVHENTMQLYDYASVEIENLHNEVDPRGLLRTRWRIQNQATKPIEGQWFVLGDFEESKDLHDQGSHKFSAAGTDGDTLEFDFVGRLRKSSLSQFVTMNLVSYDDPVVVGTKRLDFHYPFASALKVV